MKISILAAVLSLGVAASAGAQQSAGKQTEEIPAAYRPPKGMCRIWLKDVPPAQQPAPTDCASAVKNTPHLSHCHRNVDWRKNGGTTPEPESAIRSRYRPA